MSDIKIGKWFRLNELVKNGDRISNETAINLTNLVARVLDPIREQFGATVVTSGYRSEEYNKKVGGVKNSQHTYGMAADIVIPGKDLKTVYMWIMENLDVDQLIYEEKGYHKWIHVSFNIEAKREPRYLVFMNNTYKTFNYLDEDTMSIFLMASLKNEEGGKEV